MVIRQWYSFEPIFEFLYYSFSLELFENKRIMSMQYRERERHINISIHVEVVIMEKETGDSQQSTGGKKSILLVLRRYGL